MLPHSSAVGPALGSKPVTWGKVGEVQLQWGLEQRRFLREVGQKSSDAFLYQFSSLS